jgi:hypothetical protein
MPRLNIASEPIILVSTLEHAILFLEVVDHIQLMAVDLPSEHHQQQVKRLKQRGHCC